MPRLSEHGRSEAIGMLRAGMSYSAVARHFNCHRSTITRLERRLLLTGSVKDRPRPGQRPVTTRRQDGNMRMLHRRDRFRSAAFTARRIIGVNRYVKCLNVIKRNVNFNLTTFSMCKLCFYFFFFRRPIHPCTVRRRLRAVGLKCRRPKQGPILTARHKIARENWARRHLRFTQRQWGGVVFSDESKFNVSRADGRLRVYRARGERYLEKCVLQKNRWGGGSVHVWAGITQFNKTELVILHGNVNAHSYVNNVLQPVLIPFLRRHFPRGRYVFQQDNAPAHRARITQQFLLQNNVTVMDWPAISPDMSPIEHVWDDLGRRVHSRRPPPRTVPELQQALLDEWANLPQHRISALILSMRRRCVACVGANGSYTRY